MLFSDAGYFSDGEKATKYLQSVAQVPMVGPLLLHEFYQYMLGAFSIVAALFDAMRVSEKTEESAPEAQENLCIYCLRTEGAFSSKEHIVAESLGNYDTVLPKGFVWTPIFINFFGLSFMLSLEASTEIRLPDDLVGLGFEMVSLEAANASSAAAS